jgi:hypothetical protein
MKDLRLLRTGVIFLTKTTDTTKAPSGAFVVTRKSLSSGKTREVSLGF